LKIFDFLPRGWPPLGELAPKVVVLNYFIFNIININKAFKNLIFGQKSNFGQNLFLAKIRFLAKNLIFD
jgi:hypothetical protein